MYKRLSLGLVLIVCVGLLFPLNASAAVSFTDINNHWAKQSILRLQAGGYINGFPDHTFMPDQAMTRAGFVTVLVNCLGGTKAEDTSAVSFSDARGHWALTSINRAVKLGIILTAEYPNGFAPDNPIKRSEAAAMLVRALGQKPDDGTITFKDAAEINKSLYKGYIKKATDSGIISGFTDGYFRPFSSLTRSQTCALMVRMLESQGKTLPTASNGTSTVTNTSTTTFNSPRLTDMAAIYLNTNTLAFNSSSARLFFIINQNKYELNNLTIDADGNITVDSISYRPADVAVFYNDNYYQMREVRITDGRFSLYCTYGTTVYWAQLNNKYRSAQDIQILKDGTYYNLADIQVTAHNQLRINNQPSSLNTSIKARYDGQLYDISDIDYDAASFTVVINTRNYTTSIVPKSYAFFEGNTLLQRDTVGARLYASNQLVVFDEIISLDPSRFLWNTSYYDLLGGRVRLNGNDYTITETVWRGSSLQFEIYLRRV
ncbi:MAG: S-layer homology domain-containing protein [Methylocystaceae bacterium]